MCGHPQCYYCIFLSTLSLRRATISGFWLFQFALISIHALLAESDVFESFVKGEKHIFLSTLSLRRATDGAAFF